MQNHFLLFIFPSCKNKWEIINKIIESKKIKIIKKKNIFLTETGKFNLIKNLYNEEKWLGDSDNNYDGLYYKLRSCFPNKDNNITIYFINSTHKTISKLKKEIRDFCKIGNHSIHTTDTEQEYLNLSDCYNSENTIKFLNTVKQIDKQNFNYLFKEFEKHIKENNINSKYICLSGSSVLSVFNLRDCYDIDYLSLIDIENFKNKIESYNNHYLSSNFHKKRKISIEQIINNDNNHFYYKGFKFMSLELLRDFKKLRNEEKDKKDILLIEMILNDENYRC